MISPLTVIVDRYSIVARKTEYACGNAMHLFIEFLFENQASLNKRVAQLLACLRFFVSTTPHSPPTIKSAEQFLGKLKNTAIQPNEIMVSFDVTSLFTSELAEMAVRESLSQLRDDTNIDLKNEQLVDVMNLLRRPSHSRANRTNRSRVSREIHLSQATLLKLFSRNSRQPPSKPKNHHFG